MAALGAEPLLSSGEEEAEASLGRRGHCLKNKHSNNHDRKNAGRRKHNVCQLLLTSYSISLFLFLFVLMGGRGAVVFETGLH